MPSRLFFRQFTTVNKFDRVIRRRLTMPGLVVFGTALTAGMFGIDTRQTLAYQVFALAIGLLLVAILTSLRFKPRIEIERLLPETGTAGYPLEYRVRLHNVGTRAETGLYLADELQAEAPSFADLCQALNYDRSGNWLDRRFGYQHWARMLVRRRGGRIEPVAVSKLQPGISIEVVLKLTPLRRGYLHFQQVLVKRPDPLGLINAVKRISLPGELLVLPARVPVPEVPVAGNRRFQPGGLSFAQQVGDSQEFISLREYRPGDPVRHVHWRSSARLGKPLVKEFQDQFLVRQALILDACGPPNDRFEHAVSVCATLVQQPWHQDGLLDLYCVSPETPRLSCGRGMDDRRRVQALLACLPACPDADFRSLVEPVRHQAPELSAVVAVLLDWDQPRRDLVRSFQQHGLSVVVLLVRDDDHTVRTDAVAVACSRFLLIAADGAGVTDLKAAQIPAAQPQPGRS
jgi:uncharacterized protein (DUF58 family)